MSYIKLEDYQKLVEIINNIEKDIKNIEDNINNTYNAVDTLNDSKWNTKEKKKMDEEYLAYLKKIKDGYGKYLNRRLNTVKDAVNKYYATDTVLKNEVIKEI